MMMRAKIISLLALFMIIPVAVYSAGIGGKPPLEINFVVDPQIEERFEDEVSFVSYLEDLVSRVSLIFNAEIGRRLKPGFVKVGVPPRSNNTVDIIDEPEFLISWLKKQDNSGGRFLMFFTNTPFYDREHNRLLGGYSDPNGNRLLLVEYAFETQRVATIILHQIGHLCGAGHSEDKPSIMSRTRNSSLSFGEYTYVVRKNCE